MEGVSDAVQAEIYLYTGGGLPKPYHSGVKNQFIHSFREGIGWELPKAWFTVG